MKRTCTKVNSREIALVFVCFILSFEAYPCHCVQVGLIGPRISLENKNEEDEDIKFTDGIESCPNYVETDSEKYPITSSLQSKEMKIHHEEMNINMEEIKSLNFGKEVLSTISEQISFHDDTPEDKNKSKKKQEFLNKLREKMISFASAASSSTAVAGLATSAAIAAAGMAAANVEMEVKDGLENAEQLKEQKNAVSSSKILPGSHGQNGLANHKYDEANIENSLTTEGVLHKIPMQQQEPYLNFDHISYTYNDSELEEGARFISASLGFISSSVGLLADSVRIVGDTTAGITGSTMKLTGKAVRTVSIGVNSLGRLIEGDKRDDNIKENTRRPLTSTLVSSEDTNLLAKQIRETRTNNGLLRNTRTVAGKSVR